MNLTIRQIEPADNSAIAQIIRTSLTEFGANKPGTVFFDSTTDNLHTVFKQAGSMYFVAEKNNQILGGAGIYPTEGLPAGTCELVKMYLSYDARGKGLGRLLIDKCLNYAKSSGYTQVYIETMPEAKKGCNSV